MDKTNIVMIHGQPYDAQTGLLVEKRKSLPAEPTKRPTPAGAVHTTLQKSQTLNRKTTSKPIPRLNKPIPPQKPGRKTMDIAKSSRITRFAPRPVIAPEKAQDTKKVSPDIPATTHPIAAKTRVLRAKKNASSPNLQAKPPKVVKQEAIAEAIARPVAKSKKKSFVSKHPRLMSITSAVVILLLVGGYLTYINIPSISVRVAAAQAGVHATYPEYHPDGYKVNQPISYKDGQVTIEFDANTGNGMFSITQAKSSWDSTAVRGMVDKASHGQFITSEQQGLTIYSYNGNAAWVNGGILYTINDSGNTELSGDQILQIAASM